MPLSSFSLPFGQGLGHAATELAHLGPAAKTAPAFAHMAGGHNIARDAATGAGHLKARPQAAAPAAPQRIPTQITPAWPRPAIDRNQLAAHPDAGEVNSLIPNYLETQRRLGGVERGYEKRLSLTPDQANRLDAVKQHSKSLENELMQRSPDPEGTLNQIAVRDKVHVGRDGLSPKARQTLLAQAAAPRRTPSINAPPTSFSLDAYKRRAAIHGEHEATRSIAELIGTETARNLNIPPPIMPHVPAGAKKVGAYMPTFRKYANPQPLSGVLRHLAESAHSNPGRADAMIAGGNKAIIHGIIGALLGTAGGAIAARPGDEDHGALRGALYGGATGAALGGLTGYNQAMKTPVNPYRYNALRASGDALRGALAA